MSSATELPAKIEDDFQQHQAPHIKSQLSHQSFRSGFSNMDFLPFLSRIFVSIAKPCPSSFETRVNAGLNSTPVVKNVLLDSS